MDLEWVGRNYDRLKQISRRVSKNNNSEELLHFCIEQYLKNPKVSGLTEQHKFYFFTKIVTNNYRSNTSPYASTYRKHNFQELNNIDIQDVPYEEFDELQWVYDQIEKDKRTKDWYYSRLFELYIEEDCSILKTSNRTTIPRNSVSRDINKYRKILKQRRNIRNS